VSSPSAEPPASTDDSFTNGGIVAFAVAAVVALGLLFIAGVSANTCTDSYRATALANLRRHMVLIGIGLAAVPALWAYLAFRSKRSWRSWAALAIFVVVLAGGCAARTDTDNLMSVCF
jgi:cell division protein FtsW (lipid II flippase)